MKRARSFDTVLFDSSSAELIRGHHFGFYESWLWFHAKLLALNAIVITYSQSNNSIRWMYLHFVLLFEYTMRFMLLLCAQIKTKTRDDGKLCIKPSHIQPSVSLVCFVFPRFPSTRLPIRSSNENRWIQRKQKWSKWNRKLQIRYRCE